MGNDPNTWSDWATVYAAIVATGALSLELRRWFESGAKLNLSYMLDAIMVPRDDDKEYIVITVANRGDTPTTITHLVFHGYGSRWKRFRKKASKSFITNNPSPNQPIPHVIEPSGRWMGMCIKNDEIRRLLDTGFLWAEIHATHRDRPTSVWLKRRRAPKGEKLEGPGI